LIILSNPNPTRVKKPIEKTALPAPADLWAEAGNGKIMLDMPWKGHYTASFYTTTGQKMFTIAEFGPGNAIISVPKMPAGAFMLQCRGEKVSFVKKIIVRP
jgi:hypothetical protein